MRKLSADGSLVPSGVLDFLLIGSYARSRTGSLISLFGDKFGVFVVALGLILRIEGDVGTVSDLFGILY